MFAHDAVDVGAGGRQHHARRVPHPVGALGLHDDTVRRDVQADVVLLAEGGGIGEVRVDLADPQPVIARLLDVLANGVADQAHRVSNGNERQLSHLHTVHAARPIMSVLLNRSPMIVEQPRVVGGEPVHLFAAVASQQRDRHAIVFPGDHHRVSQR